MGEKQAKPPGLLVLLDVLRGVALFGILCVNLPLIALPLSEAMGGDNALEAMTPDAWVAALVRMLGENKFMALFSTLFGMGLALQIDRAEARGVAPGSFYPRRLLVLAGFGALNAVLIFFGVKLGRLQLARHLRQSLQHCLRTGPMG